ncbi:endopeptidase La [Intestinibacillus massiliensis]|uniref:endopeptidase La n=1 Tax=Intestinibacillus massiliensis TaxID=1871029 RepID=UPI000B355094|nr:endopeptidase La [Intestinibacillus massiliensis]
MPNNEEKAIRLLPVLPLRGLTAFPEMLIHFDVGRAMSIKALEAAMKDGQVLFLTAQQELKLDEPGPGDLYQVGTICIVKQILRLPGDNIRVLVEGRARAMAHEFIQGEGDPACLFAQVEVLHDEPVTAPERREQALIRTVQDRFDQYAQLAQRVSNDVVVTVASGGQPGYLADFIAQNMAVDYDVKQDILEELDPIRRLTSVIRLLTDEVEILKLENEIQDELKTQIDKNQRDYYLREQIKVIQSELGEQDAAAEAEEYREKVQALKLPQEIEDKLLREVDRMAKMGGATAEGAVIRTYLDSCIELPWGKETKDKLNLERARKVLDRDHYGLEKVKERILEFIAVKALAPDLKGQVLCLVGPPGVGKTSIAKSIAESMGRKYVRLSLGGMRDEADIRGHRKTYIGAMPGRIMAAMRQAGSRNPLMLLDEIDKMGNDFRGDPASAMLEVLDSEQNFAFRDHYLELPFDLSDVLFVTTANDLGTVPRPLLDRMEVIELSSYTEEEKLQIAKRHLLPKQMKKHGLKKTNLSVDDTVLHDIIMGYTREAGVRALEQVLAKLCRRTAKQVADGEATKLTVTAENMEKVLGVARYKDDIVSGRDEVGIVNGLAWTSVGGEMLQVEVSAIEGTGKIEITGNLGTVMKESAQAAVTYVRSRARTLDIDPMFYKNTDLHIHFPEAAIPKDGPSAGITMATAIVSALTDAPVYGNVAMTGEVTLRGRVLPIGGLREKTMAAYRAKMKTVIIPKENESDLQEIEPVVRDNVKFILAEHMDTVMEHAIDFSRRAAKKLEPAGQGEKDALPIPQATAPAATAIRQ